MKNETKDKIVRRLELAVQNTKIYSENPDIAMSEFWDGKMAAFLDAIDFINEVCDAETVDEKIPFGDAVYDLVKAEIRRGNIAEVQTELLATTAAVVSVIRMKETLKDIGFEVVGANQADG